MADKDPDYSVQDEGDDARYEVEMLVLALKPARLRSIG
jgi:hypothetical protein